MNTAETEDVQEVEPSATDETPEILNLDLEASEDVQEQETPEPEAEESVEEESSTDESAEPEAETQEAESGQEEPEEVKKPTPKVPLPRLRKEIQKRKDLEQKLQELESKVAAESKPNPEPKQTSSELPKMPTMADVGYDEVKHQEAMTSYLDELTEYKLNAREQERKRSEQERAVQAVVQKSEERLQSFFESNEEYQEVLQELVDNEEVVQYPPAVSRAVQLSDFGPQLDLYLLKNRSTVLPELSAMPPEQQLMEIGRIQASLQSTPVKKQEVATLTKAPPPIKKATGGARSVSEDTALKEIYKDFVIK